MKKDKIKLLFTADTQVKVRNTNLHSVYSANLADIATVAREECVDVVVISGDLFEYCHPNESEVSLIYNFISDVVTMDHVREVVIIPGNHDLEKLHRRMSYSDDLQHSDHNSISLFVDVLNRIDSEMRSKIIYIDHSGLYESKFSDIIYVGYSLEDDKAITQEMIDSIPESKICVCIFHDMIKEYVDSVNVPQRQDKYDRLMSVNQFPPESLILAGDIHTNLRYEGESNQLFLYPGSPQQHTHNEGSFYTVGRDVVCDVRAAVKSVKVFEITPDKMSKDGEVLRPYTYRDVELKDYVRYVTISLDHTVGWDDVCRNLKQMAAMSDMYGLAKTYIKVKSSNALLDHNSDIIDIFQREGVFVSVTADKLINTINTETTNKIVSDIIQKQEESGEKGLDFEFGTELTNDDIIRMFQWIVDDVASKNDIPSDTRADIVDLFINQLNNVGNINDKQYKVVFKSIRCNQFMSLGGVDLNLDIPGITRILGTNGVGKTSLFRMIRWALTGEAFPGMSKRSTTANSLVVFNNNIPDNDEVLVTLSFTVNDSVIELSRKVLRRWKNNTTRVQKISINKNDYVSGVDKELTMVIRKGDDVKTLTGDSAQRSVDMVFSDVLDNIVFIDYPSLNALINADPQDMENMCLRYIGLSFIDKMKDSLPDVKDELMSTVTKPTVKLADVVAEMNDVDVNISDIRSKRDVAEAELIDNQKILDDYNNDLDRLNADLVQIGDVPVLLSRKKDEYNAAVADVDGFVIREKKQMLLLPQKPVIDQVHIDKLQYLVKEKSDELDVSRRKYNELKERITKLRHDVIVEYKNGINKNISELSDALNKRIEDMSVDYVNQSTRIGVELTSLRGVESELLNEIVSVADVMSQKIKSKISELSDRIQSLMTKINIVDKSISDNESQILNRVCSMCGREFDNHEEHARELESRNEALRSDRSKYESEITDVRSKVDALNRRFDEIYQSVTNRDFGSLRITDLDDKVDKYIKCRGDIRALTEEMDNMQRPDIDTDAEVVRLRSMIDELRVSETKDPEMSEDIINGERELEVLLHVCETVEDVLRKSREELSDLLRSKDELIERYTVELSNVSRENELINKYNSEVDDHNSKINVIKERVSMIKTEIDGLESKMGRFTELSAEKERIVSGINTSKQLIYEKRGVVAECDARLLEMNRRMEQLSDVRSNIIKYENAQLVWKVYQNIVSKRLTDVVFEYYRVKINEVLNELLEDVDFKMYWAGSDQGLNLFKVDVSRDGVVTYQLAKQSSGMEISFMGISLIYAIHLINSRSVSHIFCDELSGALSDGSNIEYETQNFQELFVRILQKFHNKSTFIVDHNIKNLFETVTYQVSYGGEGNEIKAI